MKKLFVFMLAIALVLGNVWMPANAAAKSQQKTVSINGIVAPVDSGWTEQSRQNEMVLFSGKDTSPKDLLYVVWSMPTKNRSAETSLAKLLKKKSSKTKVIKALSKIELFQDVKLTKKDITLKKDSTGKYMAILDFSYDGYESDYLVLRNIDDRFVALYGAASANYQKITSKTKKTVQKYAKKMVADERGMTVTLMDDLIVPYDDSWTLKRSSANYKDFGYDDDYGYAEFAVSDDKSDENINVDLKANLADAEEETVMVSSLIKDKANFEMLKDLLSGLLQIAADDIDDIDENSFEYEFSMESDGHGSNYFMIDAGAGIALVRVVDEKYIIMCEVMDERGEKLSDEIINQSLKMVNDLYVE